MTIKELREKYNLTQSALARSLGVSSNAISGIEAGRIKLSPKMSAKIKEVYGEEVAAAAPATEKKATPAKKAAPKKKAVAEKPAEAAAPVDAPVEKKSRKKAAEEPIAVEAAAAAPVAATVEKKTPAKKSQAKKKAAAEKPAETVTAEAAAPVEAPAAPVEKKAPAKKAATKKPAPKKAPAKPAPSVILQSPFGGEVTAEQILSKVGDVDKVYVRIDQNKLYWVKGDEAGAIDIW